MGCDERRGPMATVRKRTWKSGGETKTAWIADYFDQDGKRHIKTCKTKKEADGFLVQARHEVARGVHTPENASITVAEAGKLWIETGEIEKLERSTLRQYGNHLKLHINPLIGGVKLARLSTPGIEAFRDELLKKGSRAMARKVLSSLKSILGEAQRRGLIAQNSAQPVKGWSMRSRSGGWHARDTKQRRVPAATYGSCSQTAMAGSRTTRTSRIGASMRSSLRPASPCPIRRRETTTGTRR